MLYDLSGSKKSKMAAAIPEVPKSQQVDRIGTEFQRLYVYFQGIAIQWDY